MTARAERKGTGEMGNKWFSEDATVYGACDPSTTEIHQGIPDTGVDGFLARYANPTTRRKYRNGLTDLFASLGWVAPQDVTEGDLFGWVAAPGLANNTVRQRLSLVRSYFGWCHREGSIPKNPALGLDPLTKQFPKTYGKVQDKHPGRWLTKEEAFGILLGACSDGTWLGSRDQLAFRLGLLGVRAEEAIRLTWAALTPSNKLQWIGKGRRSRSVEPGPTLLALLARWRRQYEKQIGRPVRASDPILCTSLNGGYFPNGDRPLQWGKPIRNPLTFGRIITRRAEVAALGHVCAHDLRRTAAGILHDERSADGGHLYDLLDIQQVLDHADPATTQRSYLDPKGSDVKHRAGGTLD